MAPGHDEVDTADELEALPFTSITMSAYELDPKVRRALCMHHCTNPPFAPHRSHPCFTGLSWCSLGLPHKLQHLVSRGGAPPPAAHP